MEEYTRLNIEFYNPQVKNWNPALAEIEAEHLANDPVILFPITGETYATGSLSEVGFSILNAIKLENRRDFVIMIEKELEPKLMKNALAAQESLRSRALVIQHLKKLRLSNLYLVNTLEEMLEISIELYRAEVLKTPFKKFNLKD